MHQNVSSARILHRNTKQVRATFNEIIEEISSDRSVLRTVLMPVPLVPDASTSATSVFVKEPQISDPALVRNEDPSTDDLQPEQRAELQPEQDAEQREQQEMAGGDPVTTRTSRKRTRSVGNWEKNVTKRARQAGEAYVSVHKGKGQEGKLIASRSIKPGCHEKCRNKCRTHLSEEERILLFREFWATATHKEKWEYLVRRVDTFHIKNRKTHWESRRNESRSYSFRVNGRVVKVCKVMFLDTLGINEQWVRTALLKQGMGSALKSDNRDKNCVRRTLNPDLVANVKEHIQLFPKVPSHYCRKDSNRDYLDENLSITKMYALYEAWMKDNRPADEIELILATYRQYKEIFETEFNLHFFKSKKDQCDVCYIWKHSTPDEKLEAQAAYDKHIELKNLAQKMKDENKKLCNKDSSSCVACFDMQKVLPCPRAEASAFYYKRYLSLYNFTVYDCTRHDGFCYMWNETIGSKGSNEIASFLLDFIQKKVETGVKKFFFYSDNCADQNKNQFVFSMMYLAAVRHNIEITYRFLETGHTQNEGDSMHALIEKRSKNVTIHGPADWIAIVKTAKKAGSKQYDVTEVVQDNIYDFKDVTKHLQWEKDEDGNKVGLSRIRELYVCSNPDHIVQFKHHFSEEFKRLVVTSGTRGRPVNFSLYSLKKAYRGLLPIDKAKLADLKSLCEKNLIPSTKHAFYNALRVKTS